jgi:DNA (cytosine-5)-methyltransferase 1
VDVLHISPPCQTWSMAHTVPGRNDDANSASLFSVRELLLLGRPRVATMEQVTGLVRKDDNKYVFGGRG